MRVAEFLNNSQVLRVINSFCTNVGKGNCRDNVTDAVDVNLEKESLPLPRRKRKRPNDKENDLPQLKRYAPYLLPLPYVFVLFLNIHLCRHYTSLVVHVVKLYNQL